MRLSAPGFGARGSNKCGRTMPDRRAEVRSRLPVALVAVLMLGALFGFSRSAALAAPAVVHEETYTYDASAVARVDVHEFGADASPARFSDAQERSASPPTAAQGTSTTHIAPVVATNSALDVGGANFAQTTASGTFSSGGSFAGQSIDDVAGALQSGAMSVKDVPIQVIVQDGNTLILNTRSALALEQAGIPRSAWNVVNMSGDAAAQARLAAQLARNGLDSTGTGSVRITGGG